jgi:hypothetical protein
LIVSDFVLRVEHNGSSKTLWFWNDVTDSPTLADRAFAVVYRTRECPEGREFALAANVTPAMRRKEARHVNRIACIALDFPHEKSI